MRDYQLDWHIDRKNRMSLLHLHPVPIIPKLCDSIEQEGANAVPIQPWHALFRNSEAKQRARNYAQVQAIRQNHNAYCGQEEAGRRVAPGILLMMLQPIQLD